MGDHFAAFSFVDRITDYEPEGRARAAFFAVPDGRCAAFPSCLVAEAVGQLAAWVAMAHIDFRGRPVAALAHRDALPARRRRPADARARRRHRELRRRRGRLSRLGATSTARARSSSSIASGRCCRSRSSIRRRCCASASACCAAPARPRAASTASRLPRRAPARSSRANRRPRRCTCRSRRHSSATISRAGRCFPRRCC